MINRVRALLKKNNIKTKKIDDNTIEINSKRMDIAYHIAEYYAADWEEFWGWCYIKINPDFHIIWNYEK